MRRLRKNNPSYSSQLVFGEAQSRQNTDVARQLRRVPIEPHKQTQQNRVDLSKLLEALKEELHAGNQQEKQTNKRFGKGHRGARMVCCKPERSAVFEASMS